MSKLKSITYAKSGVNIELGDDVSKILYNAAKVIGSVTRKPGITIESRGYDATHNQL